MKKIVFLIIGTLLVLGLVLPGCGNGNGVVFDQYITIAIPGPHTFIQGRDHWAGATMARDAINDDGGVTVGSLVYGIALEKVETNEILDLTGADGVTALSAVIDDVDFVVGGFRTESLLTYRHVALNASKIFIDCGAASTIFQQGVFTNYPYYKYWFKGTPYNEIFLVTQMLKQLGAVNGALQLQKGPGEPAQLRLAVMKEDATWCNPMLPYIIGGCAALGINYTGYQNCGSYDTNLSGPLTAIAASDPHIVCTILSGPPGKAYGAQQATYLPDTFSMGINVEAQDIDYHNDTGAEYHCTLDTWAEDVELTPTTVVWFDDFKDTTGRYPTYCAATHDTIYGLKEAIESEGLNTGAIIDYMEDFDNAYTGVAAKTVWYSDIVTYNATLGYLSFNQSMAIYPHLPALYGVDEPTLEASWALYALGAAIGNPSLDGFTTSHGFLPHDTAYGPGLQTGQGVQWKQVGATWVKVGWWPMVATATGANIPAVDLSPADMATLKAAGLCDKFGNWNFAYSGSVALGIPPEWISHFGP